MNEYWETCISVGLYATYWKALQHRIYTVSNFFIVMCDMVLLRHHTEMHFQGLKLQRMHLEKKNPVLQYPLMLIWKVMGVVITQSPKVCSK
jgi:hypothetical protein